MATSVAINDDGSSAQEDDIRLTKEKQSRNLLKKAAVLLLVLMGVFLLSKVRFPLIFVQETVGMNSTTGGIYLRNQPSQETGHILATLSPGEIFVVDGRDWGNQWYHVITATGSEGWVSLPLVWTIDHPILPLPLHRSQRILEFYYAIGMVFICALVIDRRKDPLDLVLVGFALLAIFIPVQQDAVWAGHVLVGAAYAMVGFACWTGKFDFTPAYMFTGLVAVIVSIFHAPGNFTFVGAEGAAMLNAILTVFLAIAEQIREQCKIGMLLSTILCIPVGILTFTASPILLAVGILISSVFLPTSARMLQENRLPDDKWLICEDWLTVVANVKDKSHKICFATDILGMAISVVVLFSL